MLLVHDFADAFLEAAKLFHYAKYSTTCDIVFGVFSVTWVVTRLGLFPSWIIFR